MVCINSNSVKITVNPLPATGVIANTSICTGTAITIGAAVVTAALFVDSSPTGFTSTQPNPYVFPTATTTYALTETNSNGCFNSNSVKISVNPLPAAGVNSNTSICTGTSITMGNGC